MVPRVGVGFLWPSREWSLFVLCPQGDCLRPEAVKGIRLPGFRITLSAEGLSRSLSPALKRGEQEFGRRAKPCRIKKFVFVFLGARLLIVEVGNVTTVWPRRGLNPAAKGSWVSKELKNR